MPDAQVDIPLASGMALRIAEAPGHDLPYATGRLQRGLLLVDQGESLADEAVGFGVPVLKRGLQTVFPGSAQFVIEPLGPRSQIRADYELNLVERLARDGHGILNPSWLYGVKDLFAATIRRLPQSRAALTTLSSRLRQLLGLQTSYSNVGFEARLSLKYLVDPAACTIRTELDCSTLPDDVTEVVLMHEQGAHAFDQYEDSSGLRLHGDQIGCWDEVRAPLAWFSSRARKVRFRLGRVEGVRLFRGRELVGSRLAWAGFGLSLPPDFGRCQHDLTISRSA